MQRKLLAAFRASSDGRSLVTALAVLIALSAVLGSTSASAAAIDFEHCIRSPVGTLPSAQHDLSCCPGMTGGTPSLPPPVAPALELPYPPGERTNTAPGEVWIPEALVDPGYRPRGPPAVV